MTRVKRGSRTLKKRQHTLRRSKGFRGAHGKLSRIASQQQIKALKYSYISTRQRKRTFRRIWINRINNSARLYDINYSQLICNLKKNHLNLNRKTLAQLTIFDPLAFRAIV